MTGVLPCSTEADAAVGVGAVDGALTGWRKLLNEDEGGADVAELARRLFQLHHDRGVGEDRLNALDTIFTRNSIDRAVGVVARFNFSQVGPGLDIYEEALAVLRLGVEQPNRAKIDRSFSTTSSMRSYFAGLPVKDPSRKTITVGPACGSASARQLIGRTGTAQETEDRMRTRHVHR